VGMLFGGAVWLVSRHVAIEAPLAKFAVEQLLFVNIAWGVFNLLPVIPMDGGHVIEAILVAVNAERGRVWARYASIALCIVLVPLCYVYVSPWGAMLL